MKTLHLDYYIELYGEPTFTSKEEQIIFNCPNKGCGRLKLYVYLNTNSSYCFRCGEFKTYTDVESPALTKEELKALMRVRVKTTTPLEPIEEPNHFVEYNQAAIYYHLYLKSRDITAYDVMRNRLKFGALNSPEHGNILLPVYMDNMLVYYTKRHIGEGFKRYINPTVQEVPNKKTAILFNYDYAKMSKTVVLCEGIFDAMTVGSSAVAILGKTLSKDQTDLITKTWQTVIIALDADAWRQNIEVFRTLKRLGKTVKILDVGESKDLNALGKEKVVAYLQESLKKNFTDTDALRYRLKASILSLESTMP